MTDFDYLKTREVLYWVEAEREMQHVLRDGGRFPYTCADPECTDQDRLAILTEEVGEVARALLSHPHDGPRNLVKELIQVAAVAAAWVEHLTVRRTN